MAIIIPKRGSFGESLGEALGGGLQGLGRGVSQGIDQKSQAEALEQMGIPRKFAGANPQVLASLLKGAQAAKIQGGEQDFSRVLEEALQEQSPQQPSISERFKFEESPGKAEFEERITAKEPLAAQIQEQPRIDTAESRLSNDIKKIENRLSDPSLSPSVKQKLRERRDKIEDRLDKRISINDKETKDYYKATIKEARSALDNDKRLGRMRALIKQGKLTDSSSATALEALSKVGINLFGLTSADTQEFRKISSDFLKGAKDVFGANLTDADIKYYLQTVPTLLQSNSGKLRVIDNLENFNKAFKFKKDAMDEIIAANGGIRPRNIEALVDKKVAPILDRLADEFKNKEPEDQEEVIREVQGGAGSPARIMDIFRAIRGS